MDHPRSILLFLKIIGKQNAFSSQVDMCNYKSLAFLKGSHGELHLYQVQSKDKSVVVFSWNY